MDFNKMKLSEITKSLSEQDKRNLNKWKKTQNLLVMALATLAVIGMIGVYFLSPSSCLP